MRIIRRVRMAHCKRGPDKCDVCRRWDAEEFCLVELFRPGESQGQMRLVEAAIDGDRRWWEFEVVRRFVGEEEARAYGRLEGIEVVD